MGFHFLFALVGLVCTSVVLVATFVFKGCCPPPPGGQQPGHEHRKGTATMEPEEATFLEDPEDEEEMEIARGRACFTPFFQQGSLFLVPQKTPKNLGTRLIEVFSCHTSSNVFFQNFKIHLN